MKKMKLLLAAACALLVCAACNDELGPEYSTYPEFGEMIYTPRLVTEDDTVDVRIPIMSQYGLSVAWVVYCLNDDLSTSKTTSQHYFKGEQDTSVVFSAENAIPKQPAGTKVTFQVQAATPYGVIGASKVQTYTVESGEEQPEVPGDEEN